METASDFIRTVREARGFAELGLFQDSWNALESLPAEHRAHGEVLTVRLLICTGLCKWAMGDSIVSLFSAEHPPEAREAAGRYLLARAEAEEAGGRTGEAKETVRCLCALWPEGRLEVLKRPLMERLL